jgi:hypothetical protein
VVQGLPILLRQQHYHQTRHSSMNTPLAWQFFVDWADGRPRASVPVGPTPLLAPPAVDAHACVPTLLSIFNPQDLTWVRTGSNRWSGITGKVRVTGVLPVLQSWCAFEGDLRR